MAKKEKAKPKLTIGILSDTHDHVTNIRKALCFFKEARTDLIIHAGDFVSPFALKQFLNLWCPFVGIFGNNEGEKAGLTALMRNNGLLQEAPLQYLFHQYLFFITHIPFDFSVLANSGLYTAIIFGHTHKAEIHEGKTLIINPGECCGWVEGKPTVALLQLPEKKVEIIDISSLSAS